MADLDRAARATEALLRECLGEVNAGAPGIAGTANHMQPISQFTEKDLRMLEIAKAHVSGQKPEADVRARTDIALAA